MAQDGFFGRERQPGPGDLPSDLDFQLRTIIEVTCTALLHVASLAVVQTLQPYHLLARRKLAILEQASIPRLSSRVKMWRQLYRTSGQQASLTQDDQSRRSQSEAIPLYADLYLVRSRSYGRNMMLPPNRHAYDHHRDDHILLLLHITDRFWDGHMSDHKAT